MATIAYIFFLNIPTLRQKKIHLLIHLSSDPIINEKNKGKQTQGEFELEYSRYKKINIKGGYSMMFDSNITELTPFKNNVCWGYKIKKVLKINLSKTDYTIFT